MHLSLQAELSLTTWRVPVAEGTRAGSQHSSVGLSSSLHHGNLAMCLGPEAELNCPREAGNKYPQTHHTQMYPCALAELGADFELFNG